MLDLLAQVDPLDPEVSEEKLVHQEVQENEDQVDHQDHPDSQVHLVQPAREVQVEKGEKLDLLDPQVDLVHVVREEKPVLPV